MLEGVITSATKKDLTKRGRKAQVTLTQLIINKGGLQDVTHFNIKTQLSKRL